MPTEKHFSIIAQFSYCSRQWIIHFSKSPKSKPTNDLQAAGGPKQPGELSQLALKQQQQLAVVLPYRFAQRFYYIISLDLWALACVPCRAAKVEFFIALIFCCNARGPCLLFAAMSGLCLLLEWLHWSKQFARGRKIAVVVGPNQLAEQASLTGSL